MTSASNSRTARALLRGGVSRRIFANLLRRAFPGDSDNQRAIAGAPVLGISERHFRRLLQEEHDASAPQVLAVLVLISGEAALSLLK